MTPGPATHGAAAPSARSDQTPPTSGAAAMDDVALELAITFADGAGTTRTVGPEEVRFVTCHALGVGERIGGTIRFPSGRGGVAIDLRYVARVTGVALPAWEDGVFEVRARFERLAFMARGGN